jgi:hypothetical protein
MSGWLATSQEGQLMGATEVTSSVYVECLLLNGCFTICRPTSIHKQLFVGCDVLSVHHLTASICESFWFARLPAIRRCENHCCVVYLIFWFAAWLPSHFAGFFVILNFE